MTLTAAEREVFLSNGMIVRRGMIGPELTGPARTLIGGWYDGQFDPGRVAEFTQRTFAPELGSHPALLGMLTSSGAWELAGTMLGSIAAVTTAQVQIRLPEADPAVAQPVKAMHVDGVACPHLEPSCGPSPCSSASRCPTSPARKPGRCATFRAGTSGWPAGSTASGHSA
jgi:hypothetical protein